MINHLFQWEWLSRWQNIPTYACNSKGPQGFVCICSLPIYGFAGLAVVHLSNPAVCICRQVISTLRLEHRWISPKTICVFFNSNHLHLQTGDISTFVRVSTPAFDEPVTFCDCWVWCSFCKKKKSLGLMTFKFLMIKIKSMYRVLSVNYCITMNKTSSQKLGRHALHRQSSIKCGVNSQRNLCNFFGS